MKTKMNYKKISLGVAVIILLIFSYIFGYIQSGMQYIPPHFHANFAVYINGERVDFSDDKYMEDIAGCSLSGKIRPKDRVHLHENNQDTIHIHDDGVAWGHFFANIGYNFGSDYIVSDTDERYISHDDTTLRFILNGKEIDNPFNREILSLDRLLIVFGDEGLEEAIKLYEEVSNNAKEYNAKYDPGSCGGNNESGIKFLLTKLMQSLHKGHSQH